jgi:ABC-2 type transport system permease protein
MISRLLTLFWNDLAVAFKNKTIYLIVFIPFFVFLTLRLVDQKDENHPVLKIGVVQKEHYDPVVLQSIKSAGKIFAVVWVTDFGEGQKWLRGKKLDGLLLKGEKEPGGLVLLVLKKESFQSLAILEGFSVLQKTVEGGHSKWLAEVKSLQAGGVQKQALPTWILMLVLLVSFIILPMQVAEEKEKKIILGLLQTPMRETEWLLAKLLLGMVLIQGAVMLLHALGGFDFGNGLGYFAFLGVGSFCFCSFGILLGCLCRNQASARTLGVIFYLPLLLPSALSDFSQKLNMISAIFPSYWFYEPVKALLLEGDRFVDFSQDLVYLFLAGVGTFFLSYLLIRKRWLM